MTTSTLDGSSTPFLIPSGSIEQANDGEVLFLLVTIDNQGTIFTNAVGTPSAANVVSIVLASPSVTLEGGGTVLLADGSDTQVYGSSATVASLVNLDNTIDGAGEIGETDAFAIEPDTTAYPIGFTNEANGVVDGNGTVAGSGMFIGTGTAPLINDGLVEATGIDGITFDSATIDQSGGGTILASGTGVGIASFYVSETGGVDIIGGSLLVSDGGQLGLNDATLDGSFSPVTIGAGVDLTTGNVQELLGRIVNRGTIDMSGSGFIVLAGPTVTLTGSGDLLGPTLIGPNGTLATLVNVDNTLSGVGQIGIATIDNSSYGPLGGSAPVALTNEAAGVIDATGATDNEGGGGGIIGDAIYLFGGTADLVNNGLIEATGIGGLDIAGSTLDQSGGGTLLASGAGVAIYMQDVDLLGGEIQETDGGTIEFNGGTNTLISGPGPLTIGAGSVLEVSTFITTSTLTLQAATIDNLGTLLAQGGTMTVTGNVGSSGSIAIATGAEFVLGGASAETIDFRNAPDGRLILNTPTAFTGTLANLSNGDILDTGTNDIQSAVVLGANTLAVTLTDSSTIDYPLADLQPGTSFKQMSATELVVACFAEGTRILTSHGERRVETLRTGDVVATATGRTRRVVWVGHRGIYCEVHLVRIHTHAFGHNAPHADLLLSPDHAVFIDGALIPVRYLVNGATIVREPVEYITYWHIELDAHDVLLAENLPCESYLDTGNRAALAEYERGSIVAR